MTIALIGGTVLPQWAALEVVDEHAPATAWGEISQPIIEGRLDGQRLFLLGRHGRQQIPPHRINYRANIGALRELGVEQIIAVNAVGGLRRSLPPGHLVIPDQLIDYTWGRAHSYYDDNATAARHIDFAEPYTRGLRRRLAAAAAVLKLNVSVGGTYAATQGPRLETAAEVRKLRSDGCDIVGMSGMPEAALAAEAGLAYAALCLVVNPAAGLAVLPVSSAAVRALVQQQQPVISALIAAVLNRAGTIDQGPAAVPGEGLNG